MKRKTPLGGLVYSSDGGPRCIGCGWPEKDCRCASSFAPAPAPVPAKITARLRLENRSSGKNVTVIDGLPANAEFLASLAKELKKSCGTGGSTAAASIELQGDQRDRLRALLAERGWKVKG